MDLCRDSSNYINFKEVIGNALADCQKRYYENGM